MIIFLSVRIYSFMMKLQLVLLNDENEKNWIRKEYHQIINFLYFWEKKFIDFIKKINNWAVLASLQNHFYKWLKYSSEMLMSLTSYNSIDSIWDI